MARPLPKSVTPSSTKSSLKRGVAHTTPAAPTRQSKRSRTSTSISTANQTTPKKSPYIEPESDISQAESEVENEASGYEDEDQSAVSSPTVSVEEDDENSTVTSEDEDTRKRGAKKRIAVTAKAVKGKELWRPGVKADLAPGEQVFIKLPKARQAGKTPYTDDTIHPNTMLFLGDLKENNDREWLKVHDADYRQSKNDWDTFVQCLTEKIIEKDNTIPELPPKDLTFRIYRDIRFSPDPTPYKTHFSAAWSRTGRKGPYAHYYVQIQPGGSFVGAGIWHPEAEPLSLLRRAVDRKSHKLKKVLRDPLIRKECLKGVPDNEKKVVKAFTDGNAENALKNKPKGYEAGNPNIELLRLRNYTMGRKLKDEEVLGTGGLTRIADLVGIMTPFVTYLNGVVMPDGEDDSSDDEDNDEAPDE